MSLASSSFYDNDDEAPSTAAMAYGTFEVRDALLMMLPSRGSARNIRRPDDITWAAGRGPLNTPHIVFTSDLHPSFRPETEMMSIEQKVSKLVASEAIIRATTGEVHD